MMARGAAEDISSMKVRGAAELARHAAEGMKGEALAYDGHDLAALRTILEQARADLIAARPTAVSLSNAVAFTLKGTEEATSAQELAAMVAANSDAFVKRSREALQIIGKLGSNRIRDGDLVMTHCNSKAALSAIITAHEEGKRIKVIATESRPWRQGLLTSKDLHEAGVPVEMIIDSAVRSMMNKVDVVVVGADTIASNGALINKIGTSQVALAAHEARVPFVVCAETFKFSPRTVLGELVEIEERDAAEIVKPGDLPDGVGVRNPVFDATPPEYIDCIVTEIGVIPPYAAYEVIIKEFGSEKFFSTEG
jgi:ribose 1,5-bisphosphate isomerase